MNREKSEESPLLTRIDMSTDEVSLLDTKVSDEIGADITVRRLLSVPDLHPHPSRSQVSSVSMPTPIIKAESAYLYHSRPSSAPISSASIGADSFLARETDFDEQMRPSKLVGQGQQFTRRATSKLADQVKDILSGRLSGKVTATIMNKVKTPSVEVTAPKVQALETTLFEAKATLSNPGIPSISLTQEKREKPEFPQPFYSPFGRYKRHDPGDEAFTPITLAMSIDPEEVNTTNRVSLKRPTLVIRKTLLAELGTSQQALTVPFATPSGGGRRSQKRGGREDGGGVGGSGSEDSLDTGLEEEHAQSSAMMQSVVSIMKFMAQSSALAREVEARASAELPAPAPASEAAGEISIKVVEDVTPAQLSAPTEQLTKDEMETLRLSVRAMIGLQRWKKRASARLTQRAGPHVTVNKYAKNAKHRAILFKNLDALATELPLPLKKMLHDEALPILTDVLHAYERTLGKTNSLTEQAKSRVESVVKFMKTYDEM